MKLGVLTVPYHAQSLEETLKYLSSLGVQAVELGAGGYPGAGHINPQKLLSSEKELENLKNLLNKYDISISALSCHGNPVHPNKETARIADETFRTTVMLAKKLDVPTVVTFSGCPGGSPADMQPNWVTCPWPDEFTEILKYQWNDVLIPYWKTASRFAKQYGINIALEMHPGFCVYNPETLLKLRNAAGDNIGANFDPSHLVWQGMDIPMAIRELKGVIYHFHAKDTKIDQFNTSRNGVLDTKHYGDEINRSWIFRSVGCGMTREKWLEIISALKLCGYDGVLSIEHEDSLMTRNEGLEKAVKFLKDIIIFEEKPTGMWWA